jgi:hypothetical protein
MKKVIPALFFAGLLIGCASTRTAAPSPGALEYRDVQMEIQQQQTELAVTGVKIEEGSRGIVEGIAALETVLEAPDYDRERIASQVHDLRIGAVEGIAALETVLEAPDYDRERIASQVHDLRIRAEEHQADTEFLNRQLSEEREASRKLGVIFNEREESWQTALSEREAENQALQVENKKVTGQRNTLLAIVLTVAGVVVIIIAVKILRTLKVIPI